MELTLKDREEAWRRRGSPPRDVPDEIREACEATLAHDKVVEIDDLTTAERQVAARNVISLARTYARQRGCLIRVQPAGWDRSSPTSAAAYRIHTIAFAMVRKESTEQ